jgi:hypothetical protein
MPNMKKAAPKKSGNGSNTKPFNTRLMTPKELAGKDQPKVAPKKAKPKATPKTTAKPKPKATPLSPSEKAFIAGQKKKAQITKKTGVYPNTAN